MISKKSPANWRPASNASRKRAVALLAVASLFAASVPAYSRQDGDYPRYHYRHHHRQPKLHAADKAETLLPPSQPLYAVVSIADQHVSFYDANGLWARSIISTGVQDHPTPTGIFTILEKERWHRSNIYSGAPMPFMQRITWTGVAMHEGYVTGRPASHGCIRMPGDFAKRLFGITKAGERVIVSSEEVAPVDIVNPHLPAPKLVTPPAPATANKGSSEGSKPAEPVALTPSAPNGSSEGKPLNPLEIAKELKATSEAKGKAAIQAKKAALAQLEMKERDARQAAKALAAAEDVFREVQDDLADATRTAAKAQGEDAIQQASTNKAAAEAKLAAADAGLRAARDAGEANENEVQALKAAIQDADAASTAAANEAKEAARRLEPVSIFISRKTGRIYVRQATQHLFDMPVTIRDPERPLGTHLLIAVRPGEDGGSLHWVSLTPPAAAEVKVRHRSSRRGRHVEPEEPAAPIAPFPETASGALDRIEIPPEAAQRVAELLWTGATLIISDVGMSGEGRFAMDFMILTRTLVREP